MVHNVPVSLMSEQKTSSGGQTVSLLGMMVASFAGVANDG